VLVGVFVASLFVPVAYFTLSPGKVWPTEDLISVDGTKAYDDGGDVGFTTVSLKRATAFEALLGWMDPSVDVVDEDLILGGQSEQQNREANQEMMMTSQQVATAVALEQLGYDVLSGSGATVEDVSKGLPADGQIGKGDTIVAVDGQDVELWEDVVRLISAHQPGDTIKLKVEAKDGSTREVTTELASRCDPTYLQDIADEESKAKGEKVDPPECTDEARQSPIFGVAGVTRDLQLDFPVDVTIDAGDVGGPSAGLAFTLGVLDVLTPGDLTGGVKVATTGTMALDGTVGAVGGVAQKTVAARRSGVEVFIVPTDEADEARPHAGDMKIVPVDDLDQALAELDALGGNALALGTPGTPGAS